MSFGRRRVFFSLSLLFSLIFPFTACFGLPADYTYAISQSQAHIDSPSSWIPTDNSIITIKADGSTDATYGLKYDTYNASQYLITRTFTKYSFYINSQTQVITGVGAYTTYDDGKYHQASWVTTGNDMTNFLDNNGATASGVVKLMERGLGMNDDASHNAIVEYAVLPNNNNLMRPSLWPDITTFETDPAQYGYSSPFIPDQPGGMTTAYTYLKNYLDYWQTTALGNWHTSPVVEPTYPFPWTQLGYTYYWGNGDALANIKGMTEFIILGGTAVYIEGIYSPQSYLYTKNSGQYGNGYPNFDVSGSCDTIWAGNTFQKKVSSSSASGSENTITIQPAGSVSGGQGILVWSLNYKVDNQGVISGATSKKFGLNNTDNIAVLFKGADDVALAINQLTNSGTISSPGTAVKVEAGDTTITSSGTISGDNYAIQTSAATAGTDTVTITGGNITGSIDLGGGSDTFSVTGADSNVTLNFFLDRDTRSSAQIVSAETVSITDDKATLEVTARPGTDNFRDNDSFLIVEATTLTADAAKIAVEDDPTLPMVTFSLSKSGNQLSLVAARDDSYYANNSPNPALGGILDNLANTGTSGMAEIIGALDDSNNPLNVIKLEPLASAPIVNAEIATLNNFSNVFSAQMARLDHRDDPEVEVYALKEGKKKKISASVIENMLAYNSDSILENSFNRNDKWEVFATGLGVLGYQSDQGDSVGYESSGGGAQFGFYRRVVENAMWGLLGGYMYNSVRLNSDTGSQGINSLRIGPCGKWLKDNLYATGALTYGYHAVEAERNIDIGAINRQANAEYSMHDISPFLEAGYIFRPWKRLEIVPNASLQYDWMYSQSYNESGAGSADLSVKAFNAHSLISVLGLRFNGRMDIGKMEFLPEFNIGWQHEYLGRAGNIKAYFSREAGGTFTTSASTFDRNAVKIGVATNFIYGKKRNAFSLQYNSEIYDSASNHVFSLTFRNYF